MPLRRLPGPSGVHHRAYPLLGVGAGVDVEMQGLASRASLANWWRGECVCTPLMPGSPACGRTSFRPCCRACRDAVLGLRVEMKQGQQVTGNLGAQNRQQRRRCRSQIIRCNSNQIGDQSNSAADGADPTWRQHGVRTCGYAVGHGSRPAGAGPKGRVRGTDTWLSLSITTWTAPVRGLKAIPPGAGPVVSCC